MPSSSASTFFCAGWGSRGTLGSRHRRALHTKYNPPYNRKTGSTGEPRATRQELGHLAATRPAALVVYLSERRRPRAVAEMTYAERALPSNAGVQFADREPDIALDAHGLWPYKPEARRDLKHVDLQLFESWAPQADPAATWRRLGFVQPSRHRADVVPETTPRRRRTDAGLRFMMYIAASPTSSATRPQLNPCDHLCRWPRGATFTPRRHQRNSPSVAATCSIDRSTRMTGRKRTSQGSGARRAGRKCGGCARSGDKMA